MDNNTNAAAAAAGLTDTNQPVGPSVPLADSLGQTGIVPPPGGGNSSGLVATVIGPHTSSVGASGGSGGGNALDSAPRAD